IAPARRGRGVRRRRRLRALPAADGGGDQNCSSGRVRVRGPAAAGAGWRAQARPGGDDVSGIRGEVSTKVSCIDVGQPGGARAATARCGQRCYDAGQATGPQAAPGPVSESLREVRHPAWRDFAGSFWALIIGTHLPGWRNWQTQWTQNPLGCKARVGSTPTPGTRMIELREPTRGGCNAALWGYSGA